MSSDSRFTHVFLIDFEPLERLDYHKGSAREHGLPPLDAILIDKTHPEGQTARWPDDIDEAFFKGKTLSHPIGLSLNLETPNIYRMDPSYLK